MADYENGDCKVLWVNLIGGPFIGGNKTQWIREQCRGLGIPNRVNRGVFADWIQVPEGYVVAAWQFLGQRIGELHLGVSNSIITWADLPPDHEAFELALGELTGEPDEAPEPLKFQDFSFAGMNGNFNPVFVRMYDVNSANASAIGESVIDGAVNIFIRFKGGAYYRYFPVPKDTWATLFGIARQKAKGIQEASVGSYIHHNISKRADDAEFSCERFDDSVGMWVRVPPKSERSK